MPCSLTEVNLHFLLLFFINMIVVTGKGGKLKIIVLFL